MVFSRTLAGVDALKWCRYAVAVALGCALASPAPADVCKYIDADGNIHYQNTPPEKGWRRLSCTVTDDAPPSRRPPAPTPANGSGSSGSGAKVAPAAAPAPTGFPRVDPETQKGRDDVRRKVLTDELAAEEKLLGEARTAYADGAPLPLPDEKNDAERYRERIGKLRQAVVLHEKNIEAIRKELAAIR